MSGFGRRCVGMPAVPRSGHACAFKSTRLKRAWSRAAFRPASISRRAKPRSWPRPRETRGRSLPPNTGPRLVPPVWLTPDRMMAPNIATSIVANRLRENCMVATADPNVWIETLFCSAVAASGGMQPKPAPDQEQQHLEFQQRHALGAPRQHQHRRDGERQADDRNGLVALAPRQDRSGDAGADVERDREHQHAQSGARRRHADDVLQIHRQEDVQPDDRAPAERVGGDGAAAPRGSTGSTAE